MGCVESRESDTEATIFQVVHVNEIGQRQKSARLEITEAYLVLHQRGREPIRWPLRCLRRYGVDGEEFSFESGRRCRTGPGIYTFRCRRAEVLFATLQQQIRTIAAETESRDFWSVNHHDATMPTEDTAGYLPPISRNRMRPPAVASVMGGYPHQNAVGENGGLSNMSNFSAMTSPGTPNVLTMPPALFANDDITADIGTVDSHPPTTPGVVNPSAGIPLDRNSVISYLDGSAIYNTNERPPSYCSSNSDRPISVINSSDRTIHFNQTALDMSYVNIEPVKGDYEMAVGKSDKLCRTHVYENVDTDRHEDEHVYANLCPDKRGSLVPPRASLPVGSAESGSSNSVTTTEEFQNRRINYIHLDLDKGSDSSHTAPLSPLESVHGFIPNHNTRDTFKGYAQIDIAKTEALAAMRETRGDITRRHRHNSVNPILPANRQSTTLSD